MDSYNCGNISDDDVVRLVQKGEVDKFDIFILRYLEEAINFALRIVKNREDAEDVVQEAFYRFFKNINKFKFASAPKTYFYRILLNTAYNFVRKQRMLKIFGLGRNLPLSFGIENGGGDIHTTSAGYMKTSDIELVGFFRVVLGKSLEKLSCREREVLILKHFQGLKIDEISAILKITPGTVKTLLFRAVHKLAKELGLKDKY
jgi:RNA polymerase sigma-70 factor (ECF subfamily)